MSLLTVIDKAPHHQLNIATYQSCVVIGNRVMFIAFLIMCSSLILTFGYEHYFNIFSLVVGHILTIVSAGFLKLGYVIRCVGAHGLGHKAF